MVETVKWKLEIPPFQGFDNDIFEPANLNKEKNHKNENDPQTIPPPPLQKSYSAHLLSNICGYILPPLHTFGDVTYVKRYRVILKLNMDTVQLMWSKKCMLRREPLSVWQL